MSVHTAHQYDIHPGPTGTEEVAALGEAARAENHAAARKVLWATQVHERGVAEDLAATPAGLVDKAGEEMVGAGAIADICAVLGVTKGEAGQLVDVGHRLNTVLPATKAAFWSGVISYAKARVIADNLCDVDPAVVAVVEGAVADRARVLPPRALAGFIFREIARVSPEEAARLREKHTVHTRGVRVSAEARGMGRLVASLTKVEAEQVAGRIAEMAATVCAGDRRTAQCLAADALMALINRRATLACTCGDNEACPMRWHTVPPEPGNTVFVHVDILTLLGQGEVSGWLARLGEIDPELARELAADGTWKVVFDNLHAAVNAARTNTPIPKPVGPLPAGHVRHPHAPTPELGTPPPVPPAPSTPSEADLVGWWLGQFATQPRLLTPGDGHGGHTTPPPGALTYRGTAALRRAVFEAWSTCSFPQCNVPSRLCQLEHGVAFNKADPLNGGWSIVENCHPACGTHNRMKQTGHYQVVVLVDGCVVWVSRNGVVAVGVPDHIPGAHLPIPEPPVPESIIPTDLGPPPDWEELEEELARPTRWEAAFEPHTQPPTPQDTAGITDPAMAAYCAALQRDHTNHMAVTNARCPF